MKTRYMYSKEYDATAKTKDIMSIAGKWMELEKIDTEQGNPDPEKQASNVLFHVPFLALNLQK